MKAYRRLVDVPWIVAAGHYGWPVPLAAAVAMRFMSSVWTAHAWAPLVLLGLVLLGAHAAGICPRCAPSMVPTFPTREVERYRPALAWLHRPLTHPVTWLVIGAHLLVTFAADGAYARWSVVTVVGAFVAEMWAVRTHARLRPWCPGCADGGHGHDDPAPDPTSPGGIGRIPERPIVPTEGVR